MSPDPTVPQVPTAIRLTVLVAGDHDAGVRRFVAQPALRLPLLDATGSVLFELSLVPVRDVATLDGRVGRPHDPADDPIVGAVVVADPARLPDSAPVVTGLVAHGLPHAVVVDVAEGGLRVPTGIMRRAARLSGAAPVLAGDCRDGAVVVRALTALTERVLHLLEGGLESGSASTGQAVAG